MGKISDKEGGLLCEHLQVIITFCTVMSVVVFLVVVVF